LKPGEGKTIENKNLNKGALQDIHHFLEEWHQPISPTLAYTHMRRTKTSDFSTAKATLKFVQI
jgi:hypothetical protein